MQTFKLDLRFQATVVVPEKFLQDTLDACQADDATPFLRKLYEEHEARVLGDGGVTTDESCDILVAAVLTNALRKGTQANTSLFLANAGLGCRVSPVEVLSLEALQPRADSKGRTAAEPVRDIAPLSQGQAVQALIEHRAE